jgi:hypothetical protein
VSAPADIVVVLLDSARAGSMTPTQGRPVARTPTIDELAARGTRFHKTIAPSNWTLPSHMSMFTGTYPWRHGLRTFDGHVVRQPTIASWLSARGYATGLFTEEVHLVAGYGLEAGYVARYCPVPPVSDRDRTVTNRLFGGARWLYSRPVLGGMARLPISAIPVTYPNYRAEVSFKEEVCNEATVRAFDSWMGMVPRDRPLHAFINLVDPHEPYSRLDGDLTLSPLGRGYASVPRFYLLAVPELRRRVPWDHVEAWYRATLERCDRKVRDVLDALERSGRADRAWVIVTSDHGQSFGEGGNVYHGCGATESVTRVPMVVRPPVDESVPRDVRRWNSLCDLASWMKAIALKRSPYDEGGFARLPFADDPPPNSPVYCEGGPASDPNLSLRGVGARERWNHRLLAAYVGEEKFVYDTVLRDLRRWSVVPDPDRSPPTYVVGEERRTVIGSVYGPGGLPDLEGTAELASTELSRTPLKDARMRSWGYD